MSEKISFNVDWDSLFPGKEFTIGTFTHSIRPLNVETIAAITKRIKSIVPMLQAEEITLSNVNNPDKIIKLAQILIDNAPEIISDATMINIESIVKFPPQCLLELIATTVEVNLESKDTLEKNFKCLTETLNSLQNKKKD